MDAITYKPYKKNPSAWKYKKLPCKNGERAELQVEIGQVQTKDLDTGEIKLKPLYENIYEDIYNGLIENKRDYDLSVAPGCDVQLTVLYQNRVIAHNKKAEKVIKNIKTYIGSKKKSELLQVVADSLLTMIGAQGVTPEVKELAKEINANCFVTVSSDTVSALALEAFYNRKSKSEFEDDLKYDDYSDLIKAVVETLTSTDAEKKKKNLQSLQQEVFFRFMVGDLVPKGCFK